MTSSRPGTSTSEAEVTNVDSHGIWLLVGETEYFLPYERHPWFRNARLAEVLDVTLLHGRHLRWEALDVDLSLDSLVEPDKYPLNYT